MPSSQCSSTTHPASRNWWTAEAQRVLPDDAVARIAARCAAKPEGSSQLFCVAWGGAVNHAEANGPLTGRDARFIVHPLVQWEDEAEDAEMIA